MSKSVVEAGLAGTGAIIGAAGAAFIEPVVIAVAVVLAFIAVIMRVSDTHVATTAILRKPMKRFKH